MKKSQGELFKRREQLIEIFHQKGESTVAELASYFHVSEVTIRRDLLFLEKKKIITRYYGGAKLQFSAIKEATADSSMGTEFFSLRSLVEHLREKLPAQAKIFISSGKHTQPLIKELLELEITIITNDARCLLFTQQPTKATIIFCGGEIERGTDAFVGDFALHTFNKIEADFCLIEARGFNSHEVTVATLNESLVYRTMLQRTKGEKMVLVTSENIGKTSRFMVNHTLYFDTLYTDSGIDDALLATYKQQPIAIHLLPNETNIKI